MKIFLSFSSPAPYNSSSSWIQAIKISVINVMFNPPPPLNTVTAHTLRCQMCSRFQSGPLKSPVLIKHTADTLLVSDTISSPS